MEDRYPFEELIRHFIIRDYAAFLRHVRDWLNGHANHQLLQLAIISLLRSGGTQAATQLASQAISFLRDAPWETQLLRLTLGQVTATSILENAKTNTQKCEALFYAAIEARQRGEEREARELLESATRIDVDSLEHSLAEYEQLSPDRVEFLLGLFQSQNRILQLKERQEIASALQEAKNLHAQASRKIGQDHRATMTIAFILAGLYEEVGKTELAHSLYVALIANFEANFGDGHRLYLSCLDRLAAVERLLGNGGKAEHVLRRAVAMKSQVLGESHPSTLTTVGMLADKYLEGKRFDEAERLFRILYAEQSRNDASLLESSDTLLRLAACQTKTQAYNEAEENYQIALDIRKRLVGEEALLYAGALYNLGKFYLETGSYDRSCSTLLQALGVVRRNTSTSPLFLARVLHELGNAHRAAGDDNEAVLAFSEAAKMRTGQENREDRVETLRCLAGVLKATGDYLAAIPVAEQVIVAFEEALGKYHPYVVTNKLDLALMYAKTGDPIRGLSLMTGVMQAESDALASILAGTEMDVFAIKNAQGPLTPLPELFPEIWHGCPRDVKRRIHNRAPQERARC
jgi:tetratricopeptide (TPR) repeat protein